MIVFDLSGVYFTNGMKKAAQSLNKEFGLSEKQVIEVLEGEFAADYREGKENPSDFWKRAKNKWKINDVKKAKQIFFFIL